MRIHLSAALLAGLLALGVAGCDPELKGECKTSADCTDGRVCEEGLCIGGLDVTGSDGGSGGAQGDGGNGGGTSCNPACTADFHCTGGTCVQDFAPEVTLTEPAAAAVIGGTPLAVAATAKAPGGVASVAFLLSNGMQAVGEKLSDGSWKATLDLAPAAVHSGSYQLVAHMLWNAGQNAVDSAPVTIEVDKTGPVIQLLTPPYPARPAGHPAKDAFLRSEMVVVDAKITDVPGGLSQAMPTLQVPGAGTVAAVAQGGDVFRFTFDGRRPPFPMAAGDLSFSIAASDRFGNASTTNGSVRMSRLQWQWTKPRAAPLRTSPAIYGNSVVLGSDDHYVYAVRRTDGSTTWEEDVGSPVVGHIAASDTAIYATTQEGRVYGLRPDEQLPSLLARRLFRCPDVTQIDGDLRQMTAGVAVGKTVVSAADPREVDTLFGFSADGRLRMFRREAFPTTAVSAFGCMRDLDLSTNNDVAVPALVRDGNGDLHAYVGDKDGDLHKVAVSRQNNGVLSLNELWKYSVPNAKILASPAMATFPSGGLGIVVPLDNGGVRALDTTKNLLWPVPHNPPLANPIRASPVIAGSGVGVVDQKGKGQRLSVADGRQVWSHDFTGQTRGPDAAGSMVVSADGRVYLPTGGMLNVIDANGDLEWAYDTRPTGAGSTQLYLDIGTPALACDGTLYVPMSDTSTGYLLAIITDSHEVAHEGWPKGGHDNRNTHNFRASLPGASCAD